MCHEKWLPEGEARTGHERAFIAPDGATIPGWHHRGTGTRGACLVLPDIYGPSPFYHRLTELLAGHGYDTVMIDYLFRQGPLAEKTREAAIARRANMDENVCLKDVSSVLTGLAAEQDGGRVGLIGFCLSGTYAFDLTTVHADLATVAFYGFPEGLGEPVRSSTPNPIEVASSFQGPILSFWGEQDYISMDLVERFRVEVARHEVDYEQHVYAGAGHGFLQGLVEQRADSQYARDAWDRTLAFLARHVGARGAA